jgi:hypothetical protein
MRTWCAVVLALLVTSCVAAGPAPCAGWTEIVGEPQDADVISDTLALSIAAHNRHYAEHCR